MAESIVATFDDVRFIEGVTKMTQENWQAYFGTIIPNGVYQGLEFQQQNSTNSISYHVTDGIVFVNGIMAELKTPDGYTDIGSWYAQNDKDAFFCLRVYFGDEKAELIKKTNIVDSITEYVPEDFYKWTRAMGKFISDESYQCDRNASYWDVPLIYFGNVSYFLRYGIDLRRMVKADGQRVVNPRDPGIYNNYYDLVRSNNVYSISANASFYIDTVDPADNAIIVNTDSTSKTVKLYLEHFINDYHCQNGDSYPYGKYDDAYDYGYGLRRSELFIKSGITYTTGAETTNFTNHYEEITLGAGQALHITFLEAVEVTTGIYSYKFLVE